MRAVDSFEAAAFSRLTYVDNHSLLCDSLLPVGWHIDSIFTGGTQGTAGLKVLTAFSKQKSALLIAVRGTANATNVGTDAALMRGDRAKINPKVDKIANLAREALSRYSTSAIVFAGHSLGGFLANLALLRFLCLHNNLATIDAYSLTHEGPGVRNFLEDREGDGPGRRRYSQQTQRIHNYVTQVNYFNACQPHIGNLYQIDVPQLSEIREIPQHPARQHADNLYTRGRNRIKEHMGHASSAAGFSIGAASGAPLVGSALVASALLINFGYRACAELAHFHAIDHAILGTNPLTGLPFINRRLEAERYPTLRTTIVNTAFKHTMDFFKRPNDDNLDGVIAFLQGDQQAEGVEHFPQPGSSSRISITMISTIILCLGFIGWKGFYEKDWFSVSGAVLLFGCFCLQRFSEEGLANLAKQVRLSAWIALHNQGLSPRQRQPNVAMFKDTRDRVVKILKAFDQGRPEIKGLFTSMRINTSSQFSWLLLGSSLLMSNSMLGTMIFHITLISNVLLALPWVMLKGCNYLLSKHVNAIFSEGGRLMEKIELYAKGEVLQRPR